MGARKAVSNRNLVTIMCISDKGKSIGQYKVSSLRHRRVWGGKVDHY